MKRNSNFLIFSLPAMLVFVVVMIASALSDMPKGVFVLALVDGAVGIFLFGRYFAPMPRVYNWKKLKNKNYFEIRSFKREEFDEVHKNGIYILVEIQDFGKAFVLFPVNMTAWGNAIPEIGDTCMRDGNKIITLRKYKNPS